MTNGLTDEAIAAYAADLIDLEAGIEQGQDDKKAVYASIREAYGKKAADALKLAIKRHRMDADKRNAADELDAEAERFLIVIRKPRAPRATRVASYVPDLTGLTGEAYAIPGNGAGGAEATFGATASAQPIPQHADDVEAEEDGPAGAAVVTSGAAPSSVETAAGMEGGDKPSMHQSNPAVPLTQERGVPGDESANTPSAALVVADNVTVLPTKKRWTFNDPAHRDCLDPNMCGGFSNLKLCQRCREASEAGQVA